MNSHLPAAHGVFVLPTFRRSSPRRFGVVRASVARARGFTLIEMLVSLAITLIMMGAVTSLFGLITDSVSGSRATIEMSERLRACRNRLQADLQGVTVGTMQPPLRPENDEGYFEYLEGLNTDSLFATSQLALGDCDDVLMFTVRSRGEPFVGKLNGTGTVESQVAEVMYFAVPNGPILDATTATPTRLYTLYRRVLLVSPGLRTSGSFVSTLATNFYDLNDVSVHIETPTVGTSLFVPNTLGDLTKPECRFAHYGGATDIFPFNLNGVINNTSVPSLASRPVNNNAFLIPLGIGVSPTVNRIGDDVLMTNVLAFDVQVFDPNAPFQVISGVAVTPTDVTKPTSAAITGAFVDLGSSYVGSTALFNSTAARAVSGTTIFLSPNLPINKWQSLGGGAAFNPAPTLSIGTPFTYDTWSLHYENDGVVQNTANSAADLATNGLDDAIGGSTNGIVDDVAELDTQAPFAAPIRGIRVIVRAYEPGSQQVREITVVQDFLPE